MRKAYQPEGYCRLMEPRPLTEQELIDWERWSRRDIKWEGSDVARLIATIRELQRQLAEANAK